MARILWLENPAPDSVGDSVEEFLQQLGQATCIFIEGKDKSRTRALVTLLHGNEPSGVKALYRWLKSGSKPQVTTLCILPSIKAALEPPGFYYRVLPGFRDLNRCFRAPYSDSQGELATEILEILNSHQPEAVVDIHNTSGSGPGFGVAISVDPQHKSLVSLFTDSLVTNDLRLGALMEIAEHLYPTVTIECGGRLDDRAHDLAWRGLQAFMSSEDILRRQPGDMEMSVYNNPVRLELQQDCQLTYADRLQRGFDLTLKSDIESLNFGTVKEGTLLGWLGDRGQSIFSCHNLAEESVLDKVLRVKDSRLYTEQDLRLFMVTSNPEIAVMDCLFYAVKVNGESL